MITANKAKKIIEQKLIELNLPYKKLTAKTVGFMDLARDSVLFVKVNGWKPNPLFSELQKVAKENGFIVEA